MAEKIPAAALKPFQRPVTDERTGQVVTEKKGGQEVPKMRPIREDEVFDWKEYEDRIALVTVDGQKFTVAKE